MPPSSWEFPFVAHFPVGIRLHFAARGCGAPIYSLMPAAYYLYWVLRLDPVGWLFFELICGTLCVRITPVLRVPYSACDAQNLGLSLPCFGELKVLSVNYFKGA